MAKVRVPKDVLDGLEAVRQLGLTNMLDRPVVIKLARQMGFEETADWIEANRRQYAEAIFRGLQAQEDE